MLSRKSSDAGTRLRRSKSTTTTHTHRFAAPEPLNLEVAQKHAVAAATTAFVRAHAGGVTERNHGRTIEIRRAQSNNGRKAQGHRFLQREASLRSADAQKAGRSVGHRSHVSAAAIEKFTVSAVTPGTERSLDTQPSMASSENLRPSSQPKPHRPNASSSLASQQIRKARSMYYASSVQTGSPVPRPPVKYLTTPPTSPRHENPPLSPCTGDGSLLSAQAAHGHANEHTKSASLPLVSPRVPVTVVPNEAMNRERDRYLKDFQQRQVKQKPSLFLAPFKKRQDKGKEKLAPPVQPSMATDPGTTEGSPDTALPEFRPLREKRSISDSLRSKFKKVFGRVSNKPSTVPAQQTKASRDYFGYHSHRSSAPNAGLSGLEIPSPDEHTLRRARSRSSSLDGGRAALMRPSSRGSTRSLHSEVNMSNATSRVTSWSNSSVGDTLTQRALKRLTVIHEAKDSISSDPGHLIVPKPEEQQPPPAPGLAAFREPMPADYLLTDNNLTVDPKRVFSALMREIDGAKGVHNQGSSAARPGSVGHDVFASSPLANSTLDAHGAVDPVNNMNSAGGTSGSPVVLTDKNPGSVPAASKAASLGRRSFRSWGRVLKATIRNVTPSENDVTVLTTSGHLKGNIEVSKSMPTSVRSPSTIPEQNYQEEDYTYGSIDLLSKNATDANSANHTPSRHQIEARVARSHARWKSPLERQATSSVSPIVEASLASTPRHDSPLGAESVRHPQEPVSLRRQQMAKPVFSPLSPSVYSRDTDGKSILPSDSVTSFGRSAEGGCTPESVSGSAVIITSHSVKSFVLGTPTPKRTANSARSSRDWRAWLSHEVSELENLPNEQIQIHEHYSTPRAHRREYTQINEERDTALINGLPGTASANGSSPAGRETPTAENHKASRRVTPLHQIRDITATPPSVRSHRALTDRTMTPAPKSGCVSPTFSERSNSSRGRATPSERMNERFPYIPKGRRSGSNSPMPSRQTPSLPGSRSSSAMAASSPRLYSDFSPPASSQTLRYEPKIRPRVGEQPGTNKENRNVSANLQYKQLLASSTFPVPPSPDRHDPRQAFAQSPTSRNKSSISQHTASEAKPPVPGRAETPGASSRIRLRMRPVSPEKLALRPKSAVDLRNSNRTRNVPDTRKAFPSIAFTSSHPALRRVPWKRSDVALGRSPTPFAFAKEPTPGAEPPVIDSVLEDGTNNDRSPSRRGSVTPGQRLADRFLRERNPGSGAASPVRRETSRVGRSATASPAFL